MWAAGKAPMQETDLGFKNMVLFKRKVFYEEEEGEEGQDFV